MTEIGAKTAAWSGAAFESALEAVLSSRRLQLEPLAEHHADELFEPLCDPRLYRYIPQDPPLSVEALRVRFALLARRRPPEGNELWLNWVMRGRDDGGCRGRLQATLRAAAPAWVAYEVFPAYWRHGLAREGCACMIGWLIDALGVQQFAAEVDAQNIASLRLLERLGFERVSFKPDADHFKGRSSDEWTLRLAAGALVRDEGTPRCGPDPVAHPR